MEVCNSCKGMGSEVSKYGANHSHTFRRKIKGQTTENIISNYNSEIQKGLNKKGLNVHQLAMAINIKESAITNYIKGNIKPAMTDAKKIQHFLEIELVEEVETSTSNEDYLVEENSSQPLSLGDLIKKQMENKK
jgi:uncharacterized protein (TIGR00270 family)